MNYSVYRLYGPQNILIEVASDLCASDAKQEASDRNQRAADGLCLAMDEFRERTACGEGWHVSAKSGLAGKKYSDVLK